MSDPLAGLSDLLAGFTTARQPRQAGLDSSAPSVAPVDDFARLDPDRITRTGVPEVVYAAGKTPDQVVAIVGRLLERRGRAIVSRLTDPQARALAETFVLAEPGAATVVIERRAGCPTALVRHAEAAVVPSGGHVGIISAGTSDIPVADEARIMAEEMGCRVSMVADVGVAGLHRLMAPLGQLFDDGVGALVVAAGMDGALPSVVAGLSPVPVIGLPTSVGYGAGGGGIAALLSMLQSCAPGLAVVNIDNGIGAGAMAAKIANAAAKRER